MNVPDSKFKMVYGLFILMFGVSILSANNVVIPSWESYLSGGGDFLVAATVATLVVVWFIIKYATLDNAWKVLFGNNGD